MQEFPHHYRVIAAAQAEGDVRLTGEGLEPLLTAPPAEFGGPGDKWSPETLFVGAVADCFILSFRAVARAARLPWTSLSCSASGTLDRVERVTKFTHLSIEARLELPAGGNEALAHKLLQKAEASCLITRSLSASTHLDTVVSIGG